MILAGTSKRVFSLVLIHPPPPAAAKAGNRWNSMADLPDCTVTDDHTCSHATVEMMGCCERAGYAGKSERGEDNRSASARCSWDAVKEEEATYI